ncbi:MAG: response regulator [Rhodanobacteraceae bacterium]|nr:response regulator [Rhodanobacteraceae bacterium]
MSSQISSEAVVEKHGGVDGILASGAMSEAVGSSAFERTALVVESDDRTAVLIRLLLEDEGFVVLRAASAEAALLLASRNRLSLIALDHQLPGAGGWEFLLRLRENSTLARVPVVMIAGPADANMALSGGAAVCRSRSAGPS